MKLLWWKAKLLRLAGKVMKREFFTVRSLRRVYLLILSERYHTKKTVYLGICPEYDDSLRRQMAGVVYDDASPAIFGKTLRKLIKKSEEMGSDFIFINAWNEWGETAALEPDHVYGFRYLEEIKNALERTQERIGE